ncbi:MAG: integration host factor subunit beta [Spirochaetales bacterium]|nr:integration host factor subunit beta [Spirochaetales bacterium]
MQKKLTKAEIVENIFQKIDVNKREIVTVIESLFEELKSALQENRIIELRGFGTFEVHTRLGRKARNPKTGEKVNTTAHGVVFFRAGQELKKLVWDLSDEDMANRHASDSAGE